jgi:diaminopimelate epimerase
MRRSLNITLKKTFRGRRSGGAGQVCSSAEDHQYTGHTTMTVKFTKMTGAGNDFVVIDNRTRRIRDGSKAAKLLCDRRWGIGADGLLLLERSRRGDYRMMYYNADGSYGGMCGNGGRCIAQYAVTHGVASRKHVFEALDYQYDVEVGSKQVRLFMKDPKDLSLGNTLDLDSIPQLYHFVDTGAPHIVIPITDLHPRPASLEAVDLAFLGPRLRYHQRFKPTGTNVNVIERARANLLKIRTYERGVENETLACGTGAIAAALVASRLWGLAPPIRVLPRSKQQLLVAFDDGPRAARNVRLIGPVRTVFEGRIKF